MRKKNLILISFLEHFINEHDVRNLEYTQQIEYNNNEFQPHKIS